MINYLSLGVKRVFELLVSAVILSFICYILNIKKVVNTEITLTICLVMAVVIFNILNIVLTRRCYFELQDKKLHYVANISAYIIFVLITAVAYKIATPRIFAMVFSITKFAKFNNFGITTSLSALFFHIIGLICVIAAPIGMSWVLADDMEEDAEFLEDKSLL